ncbi:MAG: alternate F1F0 ATPase, F1 subunit alpha [Acidobacteriota bacterium]
MKKTEHLSSSLSSLLDETFRSMEKELSDYRSSLEFRETGIVKNVSRGVAGVSGLPGVSYEELIRFPGNKMGLAFNLDPEEVAVVLLDEYENIEAGQEAFRTGTGVQVPVGEELLGRVVDPLGRPLDGGKKIRGDEHRPVEKKAPAIMDRAPVTTPLQTGIQVIDALIPVGRGQRELILGDRQIGKTALAVDTIINQKDQGVCCVYCAVGRESSETARVVSDLRKYKAMEYTLVVAASGEDPPGINFLAPYAATSMAEYFMEQGKDVLVIYDDLTRHARSYRELSLLLRRPPAREAYPGDIFYIHSRLLERSTHLKEELGGGSLTALPIIETQAENISAYIPTNLVSITDGQIYLSPRLFGEGVLPPVDVGKSVSRVGGKTQLPVYREVAGDLRLAYSQFEELETFARFGTKLDESTRRKLERGRRVREVLKQPQYSPLSVMEQTAVLLAVVEGVFDELPVSKIEEAKKKIHKQAKEKFQDISEKLLKGEKIKEEDRNRLLEAARQIVKS